MCNPDLYKFLLVPIAALFTGVIVSTAIAAGLATNPWTTTFSGAAAIAIGVTAGLAAALVAALSGVLAAFDAWWRCITSIDPRTRACEGRYLTARAILAGAITLMLATIYPALAAAGAVSWIPGAAVAPLAAIIVGLSGSAASVGTFLGVALGAESCIRETHGSITSPITVTPPAGSGGGSGGSGGSGGRGRVAGLDPTRVLALYGMLKRGVWIHPWPGAPLDGDLPDACPICLSLVVLGGQIGEIKTSADRKLLSLSYTRGEVISFNKDGALASLPLTNIDSGLSEGKVWSDAAPIVQGVVTRDGFVQAVIAGKQMFDWEPFLIREAGSNGQ